MAPFEIYNKVQAEKFTATAALYDGLKACFCLLLPQSAKVRASPA